MDVNDSKEYGEILYRLLTDDSQYKEADKSMLFGEAVGEYKKTLAGQERDQASEYNALSQCREKTEIDFTTMIKQEKKCDSHSIEDCAVDTGFEDSNNNFSLITTEGDSSQSGNFTNVQSVFFENAEPTTVSENNQPILQDPQQSHGCAHCSYQSPTINGLLRHIRENHSSGGGKNIVYRKHNDIGINKEQKCDFCEYKTNYTSNLKKHVMKHTGDKPLFCELCDYKTNNKSSLKKHVMKHTGDKPFICEFCGFKTNYSCSLKKHVMTHTGEKPYICDFCDYKTIESSKLKTHVMIHTGDKPFICELCDYKTNHKSNLKTHVMTHTGEKPYICKFCDFKTTVSSKLKTHVMTHTGEKPFICELCDYKTNHTSNLKTHVMTHTGKKSYICQFCDFKSNNSKNLKKHLLSLHATKQSPILTV